MFALLRQAQQLAAFTQADSSPVALGLSQLNLQVGGEDIQGQLFATGLYAHGRGLSLFVSRQFTEADVWIVEALPQLQPTLKVAARRRIIVIIGIGAQFAAAPDSRRETGWFPAHRSTPGFR